MAQQTFRILETRLPETVPLGAFRTYVVKVNQRMRLIARLDQTTLMGNQLVAITPKLTHDETEELMNGKPFVGIDGISYIIQR
jgi:hypothetical protein